jgi:hypothetical protein
MKNSLRRIFAPVLKHFESGEGEYSYKASHRKILIAVGFLFLLISLISLVALIKVSEPGGILPFMIFLLAGILCEIVGFLGSDHAVARIWKSK